MNNEIVILYYPDGTTQNKKIGIGSVRVYGGKLNNIRPIRAELSTVHKNNYELIRSLTYTLHPHNKEIMFI